MIWIITALVISNALAWRSLYYAYYQRKWFDTYHDVKPEDGKISAVCSEPDFDRLPTILELPEYALKRCKMLRQKVAWGGE